MRVTRGTWLVALVGLVVAGCATDDSSAGSTSVDQLIVGTAAERASDSVVSDVSTLRPVDVPPPSDSSAVPAPSPSTVPEPRTTTSSTAAPTGTPYRVPVADVDRASWAQTHSGYPASDLFISCGAEIVSPVDGVVDDVRRVDSWDPAVDNPATRGGRSVAVVGDDGVRYYLAHLDEVDAALVEGSQVATGQRLGTVGRTGRSSACHVHFGISPRCPGPEWSVRRGVIWPAPYLDAWRSGGQWSPADEVATWVTDNPTSCADAMADPFAPDA